MVENFVEINKNIPDEEIISSIKNGNHELLQVIIARYYSVVNFYVEKYCEAESREDAFQEAILALYSAVKKYDGEKATFKTFAHTCIKRSVISSLRMQNRKKQIPKDLISSIEEFEIVDDNSPEKIFFEKENLKNLTDTIKLELSSLEYDVLELYLSGERYSDIAQRLDITEKSVDNALARIRKKLKQ